MSAVESAVRAAVVRIGALGEGYGEDDGPRAGFWGSGFFIAPGWVLTSAHVVAKGRDAVWRGERVIGVTPESGETLAGELACGLPRPRGPRGGGHGSGQGAGQWADPDLALVRVPGTDGDDLGAVPNALWLSDRSTLNSAHVEMCGYSSALGGGGVVYLQGSGRASAGAGGPMVLEGAYVPQGCSGGPVVDRDRGSVIGVNKGRARDGSQFAQATPITALRRFFEEGAREAEVWQEALRAHDRHHFQRYRSLEWSWPREQYRLESARDPGGYAGGFTAYHRAELFGCFAELPGPVSVGEVLDMVEEARHAVRRDAYRLQVHAPRSWREGVGLLYDPHDGRGVAGEEVREREREAVVLYAARVFQALSSPGGPERPGRPGPPRVPAQRRAPAAAETRPAVAEPAAPAPDPLAELERWIRGAAVTLSTGVVRKHVGDILDGAAATVSGPGTSYADVLVEIDPDLYGTHPWRIKLVHEDGGITPVRQNETGVPRAELERDIRAALADALDKGDIGEHLAAVDFMLPRALFDEPVEMWRAREARPDEPFSPRTLPLGQRRTVALRDRHRWMKAEPIPEWHQRWRAVKHGHMKAVPLCAGDSGEDVPDTYDPFDGPGASGTPGASSASEDAKAGCERRHHTPQESELAAYHRLRGAEPHAVPVHCARAGSGQGAVALGVALGAGHPVALWRRCGEQHTDCAEFHAGAAELLRSVLDAGDAGQLRERVRDVRSRNAVPDGSKNAATWAGELVLLYDPPTGPRLADEPLRAPPFRP